MNKSSNGSLLRLFAEACDGRLPAGEQGRLSELLLHDEHVRQQYAEFVQLHTDLCFFSRAKHASERAAHRVTHQTFPGRQRDGAPAIAAPLVLSSDNGFLPLTHATEPPHDGQNPAWLFGFAVLTIPAIGAVTLVALVTLWFAFRSPPAPVNSATPPQVAAIEPEKPASTFGNVAAATLLEVRSVRLDSGATTLELPNIGSMVVEGPANLELLGPKRARLHYGRIRVQVTEESGQGFVVETPDGEVMDLGTEFGLEVADRRSTGLVVFQGKVDLRVGQSQLAAQNSPAQRLVGGEGVLFSKTGQLDRIMSIATGTNSTFQLLDSADGLTAHSAVITNVSDNIRTPDMKNFYQIVVGGLAEDALAYVDRPEHEWNGWTKDGMPSYLIGADYVKTFCDDKTSPRVELHVTLGAPATLYIFLDDRVPVPDWLRRDFVETGDMIGLDNGPMVDRWDRHVAYKRGVGPGMFLDVRFSVWKQVVDRPGVIVLGPNSGPTWDSGMYGIAAAALPPASLPANKTDHKERADEGESTAAATFSPEK